METEKPVSLAEAFSIIVDPRVAGRSTHDLVEMLVVAVCAMLCGADNFVGIHAWAEERLDWLRRFMKLKHGIASHDTMGRVFGMLDAHAVETSFRQWVSGLVPALELGTVVAVDGKTSRRSGSDTRRPLHLVSALATGVGVVLGQEATAEKSNEITAIPLLLQTLAIKGAIVCPPQKLTLHYFECLQQWHDAIESGNVQLAAFRKIRPEKTVSRRRTCVREKKLPICEYFLAGFASVNRVFRFEPNKNRKTSEKISEI